MHGGIVIIGAGQAGAQVAASLRENGFGGTITLLGDEPHLPYQRPPLSKAFLKGEVEVERLQLKSRDFFDERGIDLLLGRRVAALDPRNKRLALSDGSELPFDALVLATGTRARTPRLPGADLPNVFALRCIADVEALRPAVSEMQRIAIIGGGYIGLEVAAVLREKGKNVLIIESEDRPLKRVTSATVSNYFTLLHRENGVELLTQTRIEGIEDDGEARAVRLAGGKRIAVDAVLLAAGAMPNAELAERAGLAVHDGILVDIFGRTSASNIYACGDCARFPSRRYDRSVRIESVQNAIDQAKSVAATITGSPTPHDPVPWFWSDQYRTKLQIAGLFDPADDETIVGEPGAGPFAVEYRRRGRLVAVDAVDNARAHMLARRRIAEETAA